MTWQLIPAAGDLGLGRRFKSGLYYGGMMYGVDTTPTPTQSNEYATRFDVGATTTFDRIGLEITTGAASNVVRIGIRRDSGACYPDALVLDAGTIDASTTGFKEITISQELTAGRYWLTITLQGGTGAVVRGRGTDPYLGQTAGTGSNLASFTQPSVTGSLPASWSATVAVSGNGPKPMLRAV